MRVGGHLKRVLRMLNEPLIWSGWKLVEPERAAGGSLARTYNRLRKKYRRQRDVLDIVAADFPELIHGARDIVIPDTVLNRWVSKISADGTASIYDIRDQINFLASNLERGRIQLGWKVRQVAPIHMLKREPSRFTVGSFSRLNEFRAWQDSLEAKIASMTIHDVDQRRQVTQRERQEHVSWGVLLYSALTRDAVLNKKYLYALPLFVDTLCIGKKQAWLTLFDETPVDEQVVNDAKIQIRWRWLLSAPSLALLVGHVSRFGFPRLTNALEARKFTDHSWKTMCQHLGIEVKSIPETISSLSVEYGFTFPPYLVDSACGKHVSTSLPESRWRQLLLGGRCVEPSVDLENASSAGIGTLKVSLNESFSSGADLSISAETLRSLKAVVYKRRNDRKSSYKEISRLLKAVEAKARSSAPIVHALSLWAIQLHREKLKNSTIYRYLSAIGGPLFLTVGGSGIHSKGALELSKAYDEVLKQKVNLKAKRYCQVVLSRFHRFLVQFCGFPPIAIGGKGNLFVADNADANMLCEKEYALIRAAILESGPSSMADICHWIFVLGYRAGLRISEALSIQLADVFMPNVRFEGAELILIVKQNAFVDTKSYDSRRVLPLHLLLTKSELEEFWSYCEFRRRTNSSSKTMLFQEGYNESAPIMDNVVHSVVHEVMREVTGDPTVRFQHLRHTFANNLIMAFHGITPPWSHPHHLDDLIQELSSGTYTRMGLYFIAQLLGHQSPSTTLSDYVHCTELIQRRYLNKTKTIGEGKSRENATERQLELFQSFLEIKSTRLRKWKQRYGDDVTEWVSRLYPDVEIERLREDTVEIYGEPKSRVNITRGLDKLSLNEIEAIVFSQGNIPEEIDLAFRLESGATEYLLSSYGKMQFVPGRNKKGDFRHSRPSIYSAKKRLAFDKGRSGRKHVPLFPPSSNEHRAISSEVYSNIINDFRCSEKRQMVRDNLLLFHHGHRARDGYIYINDAGQGIDFINWLLCLSDRFSVKVDITAAGLSDIPIDQQLLYWRNGIKRKTNRVDVQRARTGKIRKYPLGTAMVKFSTHWKSASRDGKKSESNSWAIRYALFVACVTLAALTTSNKQVKTA